MIFLTRFAVALLAAWSLAFGVYGAFALGSVVYGHWGPAGAGWYLFGVCSLLIAFTVATVGLP